MAGFAEWLGSCLHRDYWSRLTDAILVAAPQARGILFDLAQGGDVYLRILGNVRAAAGAEARGRWSSWCCPPRS